MTSPENSLPVWQMTSRPPRVLYAVIVEAYGAKPFTHYRRNKRTAESLARRVRRDGHTAQIVRIK